MLAVLLLLTCVLYQVSVPFLSVFLVFSLLVPALFFLNLFFFLFWTIKRNKRLLLSLLSLSIAYFTFGSFYKLGKSTEKSNNDAGIKVMTYNAWGFNKNGWIDEPDIGDRIVEFIEKMDPDILCLQEYDRTRQNQLMQFPYKVVTPTTVRKTTQAIFSKYPIVSEGAVDFPNTINNVIYADLLIGSDTVRVYNMHLQSFNIVPSSRTFSEKQSQKNYKRLVNTFEKQLEQAKILNEHKKFSPYPTIVLGDLNNTQFSSIYRILKGEMQDSFLEKGSRFGRTYSLLGFPLRIDYVLAGSEFEILSHENYYVVLSDHYPLLATLQLSSH